MSAWVLAHKTDIVYPGMSGAPEQEIKDEPQSGDGCVADAFMNARAELLLIFMHFSISAICVRTVIKF